MQIFINECSLHSQYYSADEFTEAIRIFYQILSYLNELKIEKTIYKNPTLFVNYKAIRDEVFGSSLKKALRDKSIGTSLKNLLFNKQNAIDWSKEQKHSLEDIFECNDENVTATSMAELAERKIIDNDLIGALVNFQKSKFTNEIACVTKNKKWTIDLDCIINKTSLLNLLRKHSLLQDYDYSSKEPPADCQTILVDIKRFKRTARPYQHGRKVYQEIETKYYWYVDNMHFGESSHLEVFDSNGDHLGESDLSGNIDRLKNDTSKKLKL
jgi:hypothetical protein